MIKRLSLLQNHWVQLLDPTGSEVVLQKILQQATELLGASNGAIWLFDAQDDSRVCLQFGMGTHAGRIGYCMETAAGAVGEVWRTGKTFIIRDYRVWAERVRDPELDQMTTVLSSPLVAGDTLIGVIQISWLHEVAEVDRPMQLSFEQYSLLASAALENIILFQKLQYEKKIVESIIDTLPGVVFLMDEQGKMLRWNKTLERVGQYSAAEISQMNCCDFFQPYEVGKITHAVATAVRIGLAEVEADILSRDGTVKPYHFKAAAMRFQDQTRLAGVGIDLSQRKQLEQDLMGHRDSLETQVENRTSELFAANQELTAMNEEINSINEELQRTNQLLTEEVERRKSKETQLLRREQQYRAATRLLTQAVEQDENRLDQILKDALDLLGAPSGYIGIFDETSKTMRRHCVTGAFEFDKMEPQPCDTGMVGQLWRQKKPIYVEDYRQYPNRLNSADLDQVTTVLMVPLLQGTRLKGLVAAHWLAEIHPLSEEAIATLSQYADLVAVVLEQMEISSEMRYLAYHDVLTGMANRVSLNRWLKEEMIKAGQGTTGGSVFFIDLDDLKVVNDTFGHSLGDGLILTASRNIRSVVGEQAFCARIGGDEFIVALPAETDRAIVATKAGQLLETLSKDYNVGTEQIPMSASIGIVIYPEDGQSVDEVLKNADRAMYAAKNSGRNCWRFYEPCLQKEAYENIVLTNSLRRALERNELDLHYQPKVRLADGKISGFEALLRWNSQEHGAVSPERFIPLAEKSSLIVSMGQWVLEETCKFARLLADQGRAGLHIAINISPRQLAEADFINRVRRIIAESGIAPEQLEMEVTESILIESMADSIDKLKELRDIGVSIALDDFGTGYSSLTYLRQLPVRTLKLDKSFIDQILVDVTQAEFVAFIVNMAHVLKLVVVAEGVEVVDQVEKLRGCDCDFVQGYVFSKPLTRQAVLQLLENPAGWPIGEPQ